MHLTLYKIYQLKRGHSECMAVLLCGIFFHLFLQLLIFHAINWIFCLKAMFEEELFAWIEVLMWIDINTMDIHHF